jgi:hypothetical protein
MMIRGTRMATWAIACLVLFVGDLLVRATERTPGVDDVFVVTKERGFAAQPVQATCFAHSSLCLFCSSVRAPSRGAGSQETVSSGPLNPRLVRWPSGSLTRDGSGRRPTPRSAGPLSVRWSADPCRGSLTQGLQKRTLTHRPGGKRRPSPTDRIAGTRAGGSIAA